MAVSDIRIGTRGSRLARWQADWIATQLRALAPQASIAVIEIKTLGDRDRNSPLSVIGGQGLFTKEIQRALLDHQVDLAVHSLKDLPTQQPEGLCLAAVPEREDVADALISPRFERLERLPAGARVGTGSLRRRVQLLHLRSDLVIEGLRGNVETRLGRAVSGELDAVVLACAGLNRLGLDWHMTERLEPPRFLPAVGQGALGVECRAGDEALCTLLSRLDCARTRAAVTAERRLLADLEGGCSIPLAAWARIADETLVLEAAVFDHGGQQCLRCRVAGPTHDPDRLGVEAAQALRSQGAEQFLRDRQEPAAGV